MFYYMPIGGWLMPPIGGGPTLTGGWIRPGFWMCELTGLPWSRFYCVGRTPGGLTPIGGGLTITFYLGWDYCWSFPGVGAFCLSSSWALVSLGLKILGLWGGSPYWIGAGPLIFGWGSYALGTNWWSVAWCTCCWLAFWLNPWFTWAPLWTSGAIYLCADGLLVGPKGTFVASL